MPEESDELEFRVARLEALFGVLLLFEAGAESPQVYDRLWHFLRYPPTRPSDYRWAEWWDELYWLLRRAEFPRRFQEFKRRLDALDREVREAAQQTLGLRKEIGPLREAIPFLAEVPGTLKRLLGDDLPRLRKSVNDIKARQETVQEELHAYLVARSLGLDPDQFPLHRFLPVRLYLSVDDSRAVSQVSAALTSYLRELDLEVADEFPEESGSWFKRWFTRTKDAVTQPEVAKRLRKVERALELRTLQKVQSEIDRNQSQAASSLIEALEQVPNAICQIGSILVVKLTDDGGNSKIITRSLTPEEIIYLEQNQALLRSPEKVLQALASANRKCPALQSVECELTDEEGGETNEEEAKHR